MAGRIRVQGEELMQAHLRLCRVLHILSCFWILLLAIVVCADAIGRGLFQSPVPGTKEILQNSVVAITFMQLPLAIWSGSMLRTPILVGFLPATMQRLLRTLGGLVGLALFLAIAWATWPEFVESWRIGEYEGEGALRVPAWPVRLLIIITSVATLTAYLGMIVLDWQGRLKDDEEAPGALDPMQ